MSQPLFVAEVRCAIQQMSSGKSPGADSIPFEIYKYGGEQLLQRLTKLCERIWDQEAVPQDFKDARIVHIFKWKEDRACGDDHREISLFSIAGKIVARVLLNRRSSHVHHNGVILPASQCGFRAGQSTTCMIFAARQIQEKCREQHRDLYMTSIDLTKAFDSFNREGHWRVLKKIGCPDKFVSIVGSFHDGMMGCVLDDREKYKTRYIDIISANSVHDTCDFGAV